MTYLSAIKKWVRLKCMLSGVQGRWNMTSGASRALGHGFLYCRSDAKVCWPMYEESLRFSVHRTSPKQENNNGPSFATGEDTAEKKLVEIMGCNHQLCKKKAINRIHRCNQKDFCYILQSKSQSRNTILNCT